MKTSETVCMMLAGMFFVAWLAAWVKKARLEALMEEIYKEAINALILITERVDWEAVRDEAVEREQKRREK